jgi:Cys-rich repeat protein
LHSSHVWLKIILTKNYRTTTTTRSPAAVTTAPLARRQAIPSVQASIFSSILSRPATDIALVCSCLQTPATVSSRSTETVLSTISVTPLVNATNYFTPPVVTVETTEITTTTSISTISSETTTTVTAAATLIVGPYPQCDPTQAYGGARGQGGCSSNCFCNADLDQVNAYCGSRCGDGGCYVPCTSDADCPSGEFCDTFNFGYSPGVCYSAAGCSSSYTPKKKRFVADYADDLLTRRSDGPTGDLNRPWLVHN